MALFKDVTHFASAADFRGWLEANHTTATVLWVGFHRKDTGRGGLSYPEALDQALCFGWIDGVRYPASLGSYTIRFTPRRRGSTWSLVNIRHVARLKKLGLMAPAGETAFAARGCKRSGVYSFEQHPQKLPAAFEKVFRANRPAWTHYSQQPPWYRRMTAFWVASAKRQETRERRFAQLLTDSAAGRRIRQVTSAAKR
jgi:uncharacterized protein YdeI (YjbR/CyaY-like superfamily)